MLFYFIPFLILLVVALALKQREGKSASSTEKNSKVKTAAVKSNKKTSAKKRRAEAESAQTAESEASVSNAVAPALLQKLQQLIHGGHYSTAEAQINQALNRDDKQHELYLLLLKLHLLQKDELATNQLLNYIRGLKIPSLLAEAENKRQEYEQMQSIENDFLHENLVLENTTGRAPQSFDQFQQQHKSNPTPEAEPQHSQSNPNSAEPLADFDFSQFNFNPTTSSTDSSVSSTDSSASTFVNMRLDAEQAQTDAATTDAKNSTTNVAGSLSDSTIENNVALTQLNPSENSGTRAQHNDAALEFRLSNDAAEKSTHAQALVSAPTENQNNDDLNFNFNLESDSNDGLAASAVDAAPAPLLLQQDNVNINQATSDKTDLEFEHFSFSLADENEDKTAVDNQPTNTLNFSLDEPAQTPSFSFSLTDPNLNLEQNIGDSSANGLALNELTHNVSDAPVSTLSLIKSSEASEQNALDISSSTDNQTVLFTAEASTEDDELIQQFPQLRHLNQVQLDLDLAQRYIEFSAFDAARSLCHALEQQNLTATQQQKRSDLLQQLQSKSAVTNH